MLKIQNIIFIKNNMIKKKVLITGSCGFIMGNLIRKAIYEKQPYQFVSIDRVNSNTINSMYWNKNHIFHVADIRDRHIIDTIFQFEKPDIVIHGAAETFDENSFVTSNVLGTQIIIDACSKYKIEKLIYVSSDETYGQLLDDTIPSWNEDVLLNPRNLYAATKASAELLVKTASQAHGLIYNIARLSSGYGPRQSTAKLIPKIVKSILNNEKISIYDRGLQIRDWLHVFDSCSAILTLLNSESYNQIYNVSSKQEFSSIEIAQKVCNYMNKGHELISFIKDPCKSRDVRRSLDNSKIKELGWEPKIKLKDGLGDQCVLWYLNNQWWFK